VTNRDGVDVSGWQGPPGDWTSAAGDIGFASAKLTELGPGGSRYISPTAAADWAYFKSAGLKRIAYLFCHPSVSAAETASFFTGELRSLGLADDDMIAIDLEVNDGLPADQVAAWACDVVSYLEHDLDRVPLTYTFLNFAETGNCAGLGRTPLWIADPSSPAGHPRVPGPWTHYAIHQYDLSQPIDRDITAYESAAHMAADLGRQGVMHAAPPKPKKHTVKKTATHVKKVVKKEPVLTAGTLTAALAGLLAALQANKGIHLTPTEIRTALDLIVALAGLSATAVTKPKAVGAVVTAVATGATAAASTLLHTAPAVTAAQIPAAALLVSLLTRLHVSPASDPEP
jgi:lysozyme